MVDQCAPTLVSMVHVDGRKTMELGLAVCYIQTGLTDRRLLAEWSCDSLYVSRQVVLWTTLPNEGLVAAVQVLPDV